MEPRRGKADETGSVDKPEPGMLQPSFVPTSNIVRHDRDGAPSSPREDGIGAPLAIKLP